MTGRVLAALTLLISVGGCGGDGSPESEPEPAPVTFRVHNCLDVPLDYEVVDPHGLGGWFRVLDHPDATVRMPVEDPICGQSGHEDPGDYWVQEQVEPGGRVAYTLNPHGWARPDGCWEEHTLPLGDYVAEARAVGHRIEIPFTLGTEPVEIEASWGDCGEP